MLEHYLELCVWLRGILLRFIVFAVGYTLTMRVMARRADVLHGEFIQTDERTSVAAPSLMASAASYLPKGLLPIEWR